MQSLEHVANQGELWLSFVFSTKDSTFTLIVFGPEKMERNKRISSRNKVKNR